METIMAKKTTKNNKLKNNLKQNKIRIKTDAQR